VPLRRRWCCTCVSGLQFQMVELLVCIWEVSS
jgi:hypothetical protein